MTKSLVNSIKVGLVVGSFSLLQLSCGGSSNNSAPAPTPTLTPACANPPAEVTVTIANGAVGKGAQAFGTNPLVIPAGTEVVWMNSDTTDGAAHTATSETGVWNTGAIAVGTSSAPVAFGEVGTFPYSSTSDATGSMTGVIQVVAAPSPCPSLSPSPAPSSSPSPSESWAQVTEFETCSTTNCPAADGFTVNNIGQWNIDSLTASGTVLAGELAQLNAIASQIAGASGSLESSCIPLAPTSTASSVEVDLTLSDGSVEMVYSVDTLNHQTCVRGTTRDAEALYRAIDALAKKYNSTPAPNPSPSPSPSSSPSHSPLR
jgi:plastocyanin